MARKARVSKFPYGVFFRQIHKTGNNCFVRWHYNKNKSQECSFSIEKVRGTTRQLIGINDHEGPVKFREPYKMKPCTPTEFMECLVKFDEFVWFIENREPNFKLRVLDMKPHPTIKNAWILAELDHAKQQIKSTSQIPHPRKKLNK